MISSFEIFPVVDTNESPNGFIHYSSHAGYLTNLTTTFQQKRCCSNTTQDGISKGVVFAVFFQTSMAPLDRANRQWCRQSFWS